MNLFQDFQLALAQLTDRKFQSVFWRSIGLTVAFLAATFYAFTFLIGWAIPDAITLPFIGEVTSFGAIASGGALIAMFLLSAFLMFPVASLIIGFFIEDIADAVEAKHYPHLPPADNIRFVEIMIDATKFLGIMVLANLLALIIYFASTLLAPVIFWIVNGFLLGREYFQMVAARRIGMAAASELRKKHFLEIWLAGIFMAIPLSIPVINLVVPLLGVAVFTHQFHRIQSRS
ncbi:MAG: EI24 domain-containing protein [Rhodobacteraceae bacterium]|nr:EI24 domain-containing protein [Paracoccaceae bacterium]